MKKSPRKIPLLSLLLVICVAHSSLVTAGDFPNRYGSMAETLFDMMDAFSSAYQRHRYQRDDFNPQYGPDPSYRNVPPEVALTGRWQGQSGEVMEIRQGLFRISRSFDWYRDGRIYIEDYEHFSLEDLQTGAVRYYRFSVYQGRLILQGTYGDMILFRRLTY